MTLVVENNAGSSHRKKPKVIAVVVDRVKDEHNDGAVAPPHAPRGSVESNSLSAYISGAVGLVHSGRLRLNEFCAKGP